MGDSLLCDNKLPLHTSLPKLDKTIPLQPRLYTVPLASLEAESIDFTLDENSHCTSLPEIRGEIRNSTDFVRYVASYIKVFCTFVKGRWVGRPVIDVLHEEFARRYTRDYWGRCIDAGLVTVNMQRISPDYILKSNDRVEDRIHSHESPVLLPPHCLPSPPGVRLPVSLVLPGVLAVVKPASIPVHPSGSYFFNTVVEVLRSWQAELRDADTASLSPVESAIRSANGFFPAHRLDRVTSGLVLVATRSDAASVVQSMLCLPSTVKIYLARVKGKLPYPVTRVSAALGHPIPALAVQAVDPESNPVIEQLPSDDNARFQLAEVAKSHSQPGGSESGGQYLFCESWFTTIRDFDDGTSLVAARPVTGRTHQLRAHLKVLGCPIYDDPTYGGAIVRDHVLPQLPPPGTAREPSDWHYMDGCELCDEPLPTSCRLFADELSAWHLCGPCSPEFFTYSGIALHATALVIPRCGLVETKLKLRAEANRKRARSKAGQAAYHKALHSGMSHDDAEAEKLRAEELEDKSELPIDLSGDGFSFSTDQLPSWVGEADVHDIIRSALQDLSSPAPASVHRESNATV